MKQFLTLLVSLGLFSASASAIEYSCQLENNKLVSVVVEKDKTPIYRYGTLGKTEITLPTNTKGKENIFVGQRYFANGADSVYIRFQNGNYNYVLYQGEGKGWYFDGLVVYQGNKIINKKSCKSENSLDLRSIMNYGLLEDTENTDVDYALNPNFQ